MEFEKCERCGTIRAFTCHNCGTRIHPYYSGTLSGGGVVPWWYDDDDIMNSCDEGHLHYPIGQEPEGRYEV